MAVNAETVEPKKRTRAKKAPAEPIRPNKEIDLSVRCTMCGNGRFFETTSDYKFKYRNEDMQVSNVPCVECDTCGGKKYNTDDLFRPMSYMQANGHTEVDHGEVMEIYWSWYRSVKG